MIRELLKHQAEAWRRSGFAPMMEDFVLEFGTERDGQPYEGERGQFNRCFKNAAKLALHSNGELLYVEGWFTRPDLPILIHHAWCETKDGKVVDPTAARPETGSYMGVAYDGVGAFGIMARQGYFGLFSGETLINVDFLKSETERRRSLEAGLDQTVSEIDGDGHG